MTIVLETAIAVGLCVLPKRKCSDDSFVVTSARAGSYQIASGPTMEETVEKRIRSISGVESVLVTQTNKEYRVSVTMGTFAFEEYEKVVQEELALFHGHPELAFHFDIGFSEHAGEDNPLHAAGLQQA